MQFTDSVALDGVRMSRDGYMVVDAKFARVGCQRYRASELEWTDRNPNDVISVYRPPEAVFDQRAMGSFAWRPVTIEHPDRMVDATNWKQHSVGITGDSIARDGDFIRVPLTIMDSAAIAAVQGGKRELSAGYTARLVRESGTTPEGEHFDARMEDLVGNHLAVVDTARAGPACRIGDSWTTPNPSDFNPTLGDRAIMPDIQLRTVLVDGLTISVTDQGAQAIEKLQRQLTDATSAIESKDGQLKALRDSNAAALAKKDSEIAALREANASALSAKDGEMDALRSAHQSELAAKAGEADALRAQIPDAAAMDARLAERGAVIKSAKRLLGDPFDGTGQSDVAIKRTAVTKRLGDAQVQGKDDAYIAAAFDTLTAIGVAAPTRDRAAEAIMNARPVTDVAADVATARAAHVDYLKNAWKNPSGASA